MCIASLCICIFNLSKCNGPIIVIINPVCVYPGVLTNAIWAWNQVEVKMRVTTLDTIENQAKAAMRLIWNGLS